MQGETTHAFTEAGLKVKVEQRRVRRERKAAKEAARHKAWLASPEFTAHQQAQRDQQAANQRSHELRKAGLKHRLGDAYARLIAEAEHGGPGGTISSFFQNLRQQLECDCKLSARQAECVAKLVHGRRTKANADDFDTLCVNLEGHLS